MSAYAQLLRSPLWQRKRLEILQRDDFTCRSCGDKDTPLNVHHCFYVWGRNPWEYPNDSLLTLCENCHEYETATLRDAKKALIDALSSYGFTAADFLNLSAALLCKDAAENIKVIRGMTNG